MPIMEGSWRTWIDGFDNVFCQHTFVQGREICDDSRNSQKSSQSKCSFFQEHMAVQNASLPKALQASPPFLVHVC